MVFANILYILSSKVCFPRDLTDKKPPESAKFPGPTAGSTAGTFVSWSSPSAVMANILDQRPATKGRSYFIDIPSGYLT